MQVTIMAVDTLHTHLLYLQKLLMPFRWESQVGPSLTRFLCVSLGRRLQRANRQSPLRKQNQKVLWSEQAFEGPSRGITFSARQVTCTRISQPDVMELSHGALEHILLFIKTPLHFKLTRPTSEQYVYMYVYIYIVIYIPCTSVFGSFFVRS